MTQVAVYLCSELKAIDPEGVQDYLKLVEKTIADVTETRVDVTLTRTTGNKPKVIVVITDLNTSPLKALLIQVNISVQTIAHFLKYRFIMLPSDIDVTLAGTFK